jgi:hypothetical protein
MKFTGLILMCASSCLALILPAIGVIQFPKVDRRAHPVAHPTFPVSTGHFQPQPKSPLANPPDRMNPLGWVAANQPITHSAGLGGQSDILPSRFPTQNSTPSPTSFPVPQQGENLATPPNTPPAKNKFGMGIWLLLGPVCLLGLMLWTFSPNPSGDKSRRTSLIK